MFLFPRNGFYDTPPPPLTLPPFSFFDAFSSFIAAVPCHSSRDMSERGGNSTIGVLFFFLHFLVVAFLSQTWARRVNSARAGDLEAELQRWGKFRAMHTFIHTALI